LRDIATGTALSLQDAPDNIRSDREVVVAAVRHLGNNLIYASEELRDDKEIALLASSSPGFGGVYQHLSTELRADRELLLAALEQSSPLSPGDALRHAADELRNDKSIILDAVRRRGHLIEQAPIQLQEDTDVILAALRQNRTIELGGCAWGPVGACRCCGGIPCPPQLLHDKAFVFEAACLGQFDFLHLAFHENVDQNWGSDQDFMIKLLPVIYLLQEGFGYWPAVKKACFRCHGRCRSALEGSEVRLALEKMRMEDDEAKDTHSAKASVEEAHLRSRLRHRARCARSQFKTQRDDRGQHRLKRGGRHKVQEFDHWDL